MRNLFAIILATLYSFTLFSQTPLSVDQNTIALWNFDTDNQLVVNDLGPNSIHGSSYNAGLAPFPNLPAFGPSRFINDQTSFLLFGNLTQNSPLDLMSLNEWSVEFLVSINGYAQDNRNIFDNGQVQISVLDSRFTVTINKNGNRYGVSTDFVAQRSIPYRVAVIMKDNKLAIMVNGKTQASSELPETKSKKGPSNYNQPIRVGGTPSESTKEVFVGRNHACLINEFDQLKCWGNNDNGQLGDRTTNYYIVPILAEGLDGLSKVTIGERHTCATKAGKVLCWGYNNFFNLGYGLPLTNKVPTEVPLVDGAVEVQAGFNHTCALLQDKTVACWGKNDVGQLGQGYYNPAAQASIKVPLTDVKQIASGNEHSCALKEDGKVWCWGSNSRGQLGQLTVSFPNLSTPMEVVIENVISIAAGAFHTCALLPANEVKCWGANQVGQLGNTTTVDSADPVAVQGIYGNITSLMSGNGNHSCVLNNTKNLICWGHNDRSQLGRPLSTTFSSTAVTAANFISKAIVGGRTNCIFYNQDLACFGSNSFGLLGDGSPIASTPFTTSVLSTKLGHFPGYLDDIRISDIARFEILKPSLTITEPLIPVNINNPTITVSVDTSIGLDPSSLTTTLNGTLVSGLYIDQNSITGTLSSPLLFGENVVVITVKDAQGNSSGIRHVINFFPGLNPELPIKVRTAGQTSCYLTGEGFIWCWGSNSHGQLGNETNQFSSTPVKNRYLKNIVDFAVSMDTVCAKDRQGDLWCSGNNFDGQLGIGDNTLKKTSIPLKVPLSKPFNKIVSGENSFCTINADGTTSCWGKNRFAMLGPGGSKFFPADVPNNVNVIDGALSENHSCFLRTDSTVWCLGLNNLGQLGNTTTQNQTTLSKVTGTYLFTSISAGYYSTCAKTSDGKAYCWGLNSSRELGSVYTGDINTTPKEVVTGTNFLDIQTKNKSTCALNSDNRVSCWGQNAHGEAGNGSINTIELNFLIQNFYFNSISSGESTICGLTADQKVYCWGSNSIGQAGNPNGAFTTSPVQVIPHSTQRGILSNLEAGQANTCMKIGLDTFCWGNNEQFQLGTESPNFTESYPLKLNGLENSKQTSVGYGVICHVTSNNQVKCAGFNNFGQAGQNSSIPRVKPAAVVPGLPVMLQVEAGLDYSCAVSIAGGVWCWGNNSNGQLGLGTIGGSFVPPTQLAISGVSKIVVSSRGYTTCAKKLDGSIWCWGLNIMQGLGGKSPTKFEALGSDIRDIVLASGTACVLKFDNRVICFGDYTLGQTGVNNTYNHTFENVKLPNRNILKLSAGENHICILNDNNDVYCWGSNVEGQLGIGTKIDSMSPVKVISKIKEISVGSEHTCAIDLQNKLVCWGFNGNAQFGNGTTDSASVPTYSDITK